MHEIYNFRFDVPEIFATFGGAPGIRAALSSVGQEQKHKTIQKWLERNYIPADALAALMAYVVEKGLDIDFSDFVLRR